MFSHGRIHFKKCLQSAAISIPVPQQQPWGELRGLHRGDALISLPRRCVFAPSWHAACPESCVCVQTHSPSLAGCWAVSWGSCRVWRASTAPSSGFGPEPASGYGVGPALGRGTCGPTASDRGRTGCSDPSSRCWACLQTGCASALCRGPVIAALPLSGLRGVSH